MKSIASLAKAAFLVFCIVFFNVSNADDAPKSGIFLLVDLSKTWHSPASQKVNSAVLEETQRLIIHLASKIERPVAIYVLAIEADSLVRDPVCRYVYRPRLLNLLKKSGSDEISAKEELISRLDLCRQVILRRPAAPFTDVHGALDLAARLGSSTGMQKKFVLMLSDLKEERDPAQQGLPNMKLPDFRIGILYRLLPEDSRDSKALELRHARWNRRLKEVGAERVIFAIDRGAFSGSFVDALLEEK